MTESNKIPHLYLHEEFDITESGKEGVKQRLSHLKVVGRTLDKAMEQELERYRE